MAERLLPFWTQAARGESRRGFVERILRVAATLNAPALAASLLDPLHIEQLPARAAAPCLALVERYGLSWCQERFRSWAAPDGNTASERQTWLAELPAFMRPLCAAGTVQSLDLARWIVREQWAWVVRRQQESREQLVPKLVADELLTWAKSILGLLEGSVLANAVDLRQEILAFLTASEHGDLVGCLLGLLRAADASQPPAVQAELGLPALHEHCTRALAERLESPPRANDDWSIAAPTRCRCALCETLAGFLTARDRQELEWPLAKERRRHIHGVLDTFALPVTHQTRRSGSPFRLVLTKTRALFEQDARKRASWAAELAWLNKTRPAVPVAGVPGPQ
jgi:hypothetical protein